MKCVKRVKNRGFKGMTYGQIKARAHSFYKYGIVGLYFENSEIWGCNTAIESHLFKIQRALTNNRIYKRSKINKEI